MAVLFYSLKIILLFPFVFLGIASLSWADEASREALDKIQEQMKTSRGRQADIAQQIEQESAEQEEISQRLIVLANQVQSHEAAIAEAEGRLFSLNKEAAALQGWLAENREAIAKLLVGLQQLGGDLPPALIASPHDVLSAIRGGMLMGSLIPEFQAQAHDLSSRLKKLAQIRAVIQSDKTKIAADNQRLIESRTLLKAMIADKKKLIAQASGSLAQEQAQTQQLVRKAENMQQLLAQLTRARALNEKRAQEAIAADGLLKARQEEKVRLAALRPLEFSTAFGKIPYPVQGKIVARFGESDGLSGIMHGMAVAVRQGAQIITPVDGQVEFAGAFRSYGKLLILNAGEGYRVLLAGISDITVQTGQFVRMGEPVGTMGADSVAITLLGERIKDNAPILYIEFRKNAVAVDPAPWWIGGIKEARK